MTFPDPHAVIEDLSGKWCNSNAVTSSIMEAISFVTPVLEVFFIRTVAEDLARRHDPALDQRCRAFIREESNHSRVHRRLNASLLNYLGVVPPGLGLVQSVLDQAKRYLPLSRRLLVVAALEHFAAVLSKGYLDQESRWSFRSSFAKQVFAQHAREELAHRSVAFDLWRDKVTGGRIGRTLAVLAILFAGCAYVSAAVPWILHRKTGKRLIRTLAALAGFVATTPIGINACSPVAELFSFVRSDFHPDRLVSAGAADRIG